jgi:hypothetical protein
MRQSASLPNRRRGAAVSNIVIGKNYTVWRWMCCRRCGSGLLPGAIKAVPTNHANADYERLSFRLGADRFFDKSSETSHVLPLIGALVAQKRRERAHAPLVQ